MRRDAKVDAAPLLEATARWARDLLGFVTQTLKAVPDTWQRDVLQEIGSGLATPDEAIRISVASGHGHAPGYARRGDRQHRNAASDQDLVRTGEVAARLGVPRVIRLHVDGARLPRRVGNGQTWRLDLVPWSETNAEAFAGLHNHGKHTIVVFDEASAIPT